MPYGEALAWMRQAYKQADAPDYDLVYVTADGQLGRYASWVL
jgi:hypothetical protein